MATAGIAVVCGIPLSHPMPWDIFVVEFIVTVRDVAEPVPVFSPVMMSRSPGAGARFVVVRSNRDQFPALLSR
jgi:hypothetical protein